MLKLKNKKLLDAIKNNIEGEQAYIEDEKRIYTYHKSSGWEISKVTEIDTGLTLYELNQQLVNSMLPLDEFMLESKEGLISKFIKNTKNNYYMLLSNELHYYTIFLTGLLNPPADNGPIQREITNCLFYMGEIKAIEETPDQSAIEIWITDKNNSSYVFYLFPYDKGVIKCK